MDETPAFTNTEHDRFAWRIGDAILSKYWDELSAPYCSGNADELDDLMVSINAEELLELVLDRFDRMSFKRKEHPGGKLGLHSQEE